MAGKAKTHRAPPARDPRIPLIMVLDDDPRRHDAFAQAFPGVWHVWTYRDACDAMAGEQFDVVYLDHDLNDFGKHSVAEGMYGGRASELTGVDVARFIAQLPEDKLPLQVIVHSWNPDGARAMVNVLREAGVPVTYEPFQSPVCLRCSRPIAEHEGDNREMLACPVVA